MNKFIVTAKLGEDYFDLVVVNEFNAYNAVVEGSRRLKCSYADFVSVILIP